MTTDTAEPTTARPFDNQAMSVLNGGAGAVERLMRSRFHRQMDQAQCEALWQECRTHLLKRPHPDRSTVKEIKESRGGRLDTWPREGLMDALGRVMTGMDWPLYMTPEAEANAFYDKLREVFLARGYVRGPDPVPAPKTRMAP